MQWHDRFRQARAEWMLLTFYERFEQVVILILTGLIAAAFEMYVKKKPDLKQRSVELYLDCSRR